MKIRKEEILEDTEERECERYWAGEDEEINH